VAKIGIVGTGFVSDLYMRSIETFPALQVVGAWDIDPARLSAFTRHYKVKATTSLDALLAETPDLILNLTNPHAHFAVSRACLEAGHHVYSEKPLATDFADAEALVALAATKGLQITSAPCSMLGEVAQTAWLALRRQMIGAPRLVYAELDDGFITQAPYRKWRSAAGAPWPAQDEFKVGCTLEHAGYYLTWLMAMFGPIRTVVAASASLVQTTLDNGEAAAPDFSTASLFFESGMLARLTCSIIARHDHGLHIFGDTGTIEITESWNNSAPVRIRRRHTIRRRLLESPVTTRFRLGHETHPKVGRKGAATMNFALGPVELLAALKDGRPSRLAADFVLHLTEVTLAIQNAHDTAGPYTTRTRFAPVEPMPWAAA
jgi:predicted dehydrogenase